MLLLKEAVLFPFGRIAIQVLLRQVIAAPIIADTPENYKTKSQTKDAYPYMVSTSRGRASFVQICNKGKRQAAPPYGKIQLRN